MLVSATIRAAYTFAFMTARIAEGIAMLHVQRGQP